MKPIRAVTAVGNSRRPICEITFDTGEVARLSPDVARDLERGFGVFLGPEFAGVVPDIVVPGQDEPYKRPETVLRGFTADEDVVELAQAYLDYTDAGDFQPGHVLFGEET